MHATPGRRIHTYCLVRAGSQRVTHATLSHHPSSSCSRLSAFCTQDAKFWEHKQDLHKRVGDEFDNTKEQIAAVHMTNLERGREYKAYLEEVSPAERHTRYAHAHEATPDPSPSSSFAPPLFAHSP